MKAMLTRMVMKFDGMAEPDAAYVAEIDYDYRYAEHEHDIERRRFAGTMPAARRRG